MAEMSPQAQAVLDAAYKRMDDNPHNEVEATLAAALRAAADQLKYKLLDVEVVDCSQLLLLADELEA